ncbi:Zn-ribbon domain-containing OB-fold protein [Sciscionella marina]|uniref:Zn-ribbon domain-containing OB-fold protein n=1 Tax=Sciscionella marina TaxID=508770 RepID=UPI000361D7BB|nr:OB-fold domain-containing protein [Sciscionella marina]
MSAVPRPGRLSTPATAEYWRAAADGHLLIQRCLHCGHKQLYPRTLCTRCWSAELGWQETVGTGSVRTFTVIEVPGHPAWREEAPYLIALVELDEGPCLLAGVLGSDPYRVAVGQRVRFVADSGGDPAGPLPFFARDEP